MTVFSADEVRFRDDLAHALATSIPVDLDAEWEQLQRSVRSNPASALPAPVRPARLPWLVAVAALVVAILALVRPVALDVRIANVVRDLVGDEEPAPTLPTTAVPPTTLAPTTTVPPTPTTGFVAPPETTTTTAALPAVSHSPILDDDAYRRTVRHVHEQLNDAVGWNRTNLDALDGSAELLEGLLGQDPELDDLLVQAIDLLRRAQADQDRDAAVAAHRVVAEIENRRAAR